MSGPKIDQEVRTNSGDERERSRDVLQDYKLALGRLVRLLLDDQDVRRERILVSVRVADKNRGEGSKTGGRV